MNELSEPLLVVCPTDVLSGLGHLERAEICQMIALLECVDGICLLQGAASEMGARIGLDLDSAASKLSASRAYLERSTLSDSALRFRLWTRLAEAMALPTTPPFSTRSATHSASGFAVRASERLSPSIRARRRKAQPAPPVEGDFVEQVGERASGYWKGIKSLAKTEAPFSFPEIVVEEMMAFLADDDVVDAAVQSADPEIAKALRNGQVKARNALAAGGVWVGGAAIVANAGFFPYILAAQLSAFIPMMSGPAVVSLLSTLVNPATVLVGVAALGWVGMGRGARVVRSQLAARLGVLLAIKGGQDRKEGLANFLAAMRSLDREPSSVFSWLPRDDRAAIRRTLASLSGRLAGPLPRPAGKPPLPFGVRTIRSDITDAAATVGLTAGEMIWHAAALDPVVVLAADFSRSADLADPVSFALEAQNFLASGAGWSLRGYTAERLVMDRLIADGHAVQIAEASNTPGHDLIVDGSPVQVKCGTSLSNLTEHFEKYPDIPVIANVSLAEQAAESGEPWADLVTTLPGFEIADLEERIAATLGHAADLADPNIVEFALSIGVLRGGLEVARGRIPVSDLPAWLLLDGASRGALAMVGGKAGAWIGLITIGPAGALILGPAIGGAALLGNGSVKNIVQRQLMSGWARDLSRAAEALHQCLTIATERRISTLTNRCDEFSHKAGLSELNSWMNRRASDDLIAALEDRLLIEAVQTKSEADAIQLLFAARDIAPTDASVLRAVRAVEAVLAARPGLQAAIVQTAKPAVDAFRSRLRRGAAKQIEKSRKLTAPTKICSGR